MDIRTVITSKRNPENKDEVVSFVPDVSSLSEENVFAIPDKITLFETEPYGPVITYPFTNLKNSLPPRLKDSKSLK